MRKVTKDNLFKPKPSRGETKSSATDQAARAITENETGKRERKTEKLREARLAKEAEAEAEGQSKLSTKKGVGVRPKRPLGK